MAFDKKIVAAFKPIAMYERGLYNLLIQDGLHVEIKLGFLMMKEKNFGHIVTVDIMQLIACLEPAENK